MPDFYTTEKRTLGVVLSNTTPPLRVPEYQRDFSWEEQQISEFWNDLDRFDRQYSGSNINGKEYFLGAAVFVNNQTFNLILDGQQRLATATILLAALRDKMRAYNLDAANQIQGNFIAFQDHLGGGNLPKLQLNEFDRTFFRDSIQSFPRLLPSPTKGSHKLILKAYTYFAARVAEGWDGAGGGEPGFRWAARRSRTLTDHVSLVTVISTDEEHAASIFETLNDRGIGLSTGELLRSWLLHHAPAPDRDEIIECWSDVFDSAGTHEGGERIIRLSWISRKGDVKERSLYKVISRELVRTGTSSVEYSRGLRADAQVYKRIREGETNDLRERDNWGALTTLKAHSGFALLMAASRKLPEDSSRRLAAALVSLIVRHNVVCDRDRAKFESTVFSAAKIISDDGGEDGALTVLRSLSPPDAEFRQSFASLSFGRSQHSIAQTILRPMEYRLRATDELILATPERVHLEHIYPQKPALADRIANHEQYVGRIGNLTLFDRRLNQEAQNSGFIVKRDEFYRQSAIELTRELLDRESWSRDEIDQRQLYLCDLAVQIWPNALLVV